jgi:hypothetical protein
MSCITHGVFFVLSYCLIEQRPENFYDFDKICNFKISFEIVEGGSSREICIARKLKDINDDAYGLFS